MTPRFSVVFTVWVFILTGAIVECSKVKLKGMKYKELATLLAGLDKTGQPGMIQDWLRTKPSMREVTYLFQEPGLTFPEKKPLLESQGMLEDCRKLTEESNLLYWAPDHLDYDLFKSNPKFWTDIIPLIAHRSLDNKEGESEFAHVLSMALIAKYFLRAWRGETILSQRDVPVLHQFSHQAFSGLRPYVQDLFFAIYLETNSLPNAGRPEYRFFRDNGFGFSALLLSIPFNIMAYRNFPLELVSPQRILTVAMHWKLDCKKIAEKLAPVHEFAKRFLTDPKILGEFMVVTPNDIFKVMQMEGAIQPAEDTKERKKEKNGLTRKGSEKKQAGHMKKKQNDASARPVSMQTGEARIGEKRVRSNSKRGQDAPTKSRSSQARAEVGKKRDRSGTEGEKSGVKRRKRTENSSPATNISAPSPKASEEYQREQPPRPSPGSPLKFRAGSLTSADPISYTPQADYRLPLDYWRVHEALLEPKLDFPPEEDDLSCFDDLGPDWLFACPDPF